MLYLNLHPRDPQPRLLKQAVELIQQGGVVALPTDSSYALVAHLDDKNAAQHIRRLRGVDERHHLTLLCRDLAEIAHYARVDNQQYRLLKSATPGAYTFILEATKEVPRRLSHPSRKTIGIRWPAHAVVRGLIEELGQPLLSATLQLPGDDLPLNDAEEISARLEHELAAVLDAGACPAEPTTVVDLTGATPQVLRQGRGSLEALGLG